MDTVSISAKNYRHCPVRPAYVIDMVTSLDENLIMPLTYALVRMRM